MRKALLVAVAVTLAACGQDDVAGPSSPTPATVAGTYNLTTVDGEGLPVVMLDLGAYQARLTSGTLTLKADGTYLFTINHRIDDSGNVRTGSDSDTGLWTLNGSALAFASVEAHFPRTGMISGKTITIQSSEKTLVLRK